MDTYQALYRKYRPRNLNEVYGQKVVVNILKNAINNNKFGHAYLFTGSRGCGKTSVAKILSRMINCESPIDGAPCEKCNNCINSKSTNCVDILEIDAASNNGVDEIRELKSKINLIPSVLKYKVYIIDEVHMLSIGAFNALLKTLEEPPEHVVFILATTELHKVPITIISRCQTLEFKKINKKDMFDRLKEISDSESIKITDSGINEIVDNSDGGMRDAIGLLDMATSYSNDVIDENDILTIFGNVSSNEISELADCFINQEYNEILSKINEYYLDGKDLVKIIEKVIDKLKEEMFKNENKNICSIIEKLLETLDKMKSSSLAKVHLEVCIYKMGNNDTKFNHEDIDYRVKSLSTETVSKKNEEKVDIKIESTPKVEKIEVKEEPETRTVVIKKTSTFNVKNKDIRVNNTFVDASKEDLNNIKNIWKQLNDYTFDKDYGALVCELLDATPVAASSSHLILTYPSEAIAEKANNLLEKYEDVLASLFNLTINIIFIKNTEWDIYKKEYVSNLKNNVKYNYISEEPQLENEVTEEISDESNKEESDLLKKASELFDMSKIEIKER